MPRHAFAHWLGTCIWRQFKIIDDNNCMYILQLLYKYTLLVISLPPAFSHATMINMLKHSRSDTFKAFYKTLKRWSTFAPRPGQRCRLTSRWRVLVLRWDSNPLPCDPQSGDFTTSPCLYWLIMIRVVFSTILSKEGTRGRCCKVPLWPPTIKDKWSQISTYIKYSWQIDRTTWYNENSDDTSNILGNILLTCQIWIATS